MPLNPFAINPPAPFGTGFGVTLGPVVFRKGLNGSAASLGSLSSGIVLVDCGCTPTPLTMPHPPSAHDQPAEHETPQDPQWEVSLALLTQRPLQTSGSESGQAVGVGGTGGVGKLIEEGGVVVGDGGGIELVLEDGGVGGLVVDDGSRRGECVLDAGDGISDDEACLSGGSALEVVDEVDLDLDVTSIHSLILGS
tara:strand:+ start:102 stop:686 length:585 start_codon:yes stop_codon:yes gene_type:complete